MQISTSRVEEVEDSTTILKTRASIEMALKMVLLRRKLRASNVRRCHLSETIASP